MKPQLLTELLAKALHEEVGLKIQTNNPKALAIQLDNHKRWIEEFSGLIVCLPAVEGQVYITHRSVELS